MKAFPVRPPTRPPTRLRGISLAVLLLGCACGGATSTSLLDVSSSGNTTTGSFSPLHAWSVTYSWDCTSSLGPTAANGHFTYQLVNADDNSLAAEHPEETGHGVKGGREVRYQRPGPYYLVIASDCSWHVQVRS